MLFVFSYPSTIIKFQDAVFSVWQTEDNKRKKTRQNTIIKPIPRDRVLVGGPEVELKLKTKQNRKERSGRKI